MFVAIGFTLSCFGLLLFLWITFGGAIPFKAESYQFSLQVSEGVTLGKETDVRIGGVSVGKVKQLSLPPEGNATEVLIELDPKFGPIRSDSRAILRQKTLLGESYIELTGGTEDAEFVPDGGDLGQAQTADSTQIDEIFQALDDDTREAFQIWQQNAAIGVRGRGLDLNDALGNLGPFTTDATGILRILERQEQSVKGLVRDTGAVFEALSARDQELAGLIVNSNTTFKAIASRDAALAETIQIFPTFNEETRLTLNRLAVFAEDTHPLVNDLKPVADDLTPTLQAIERLAPDLKHLLLSLDPLIDASQTGLPALRKVIDGAAPLLAALDPFLANLNPIIRYTRLYKKNVSDFLIGPGVGTSGTLAPIPGQPAPRHALRQISYTSPESLSIRPSRAETNRGNGYLPANIIPTSVRALIFPNFDCIPSGGPVGASEAEAACVVAGDFPEAFGGEQAPQVRADP